MTTNPAGYSRAAGTALVTAAVAGAASQAEMPTVAEVMHRWQPGEPWSWSDEARDLWTRDLDKMQALEASIRRVGLRPALPDEEPIILGDDGRVWSGHHRLVVAYGIDPLMRLPLDTEIHAAAHCDCCGHRPAGDPVPGRPCPCFERDAWEGRG